MITMVPPNQIAGADAFEPRDFPEARRLGKLLCGHRSAFALGDATVLHIHHSHERMKRTVIFIVGLLTFFAVILLATPSSPDSKKLSQGEFIAMVQSNLLAKVRVYYPPKLGQVDGVPTMLNEVRGTFYKTDAAGRILKAQGMSRESAFIALVHLTPELEQTLLTRTNFSVVSPHPLVQKVSEWFVRSK